MHILINDGLSESAIAHLEAGKHTVKSVQVAASQLANYINKNKIEVLVVRSATKVTRELLEACPSLKFVIRAGIGMDNIDLAAAEDLGIATFNTPGVSSRSVAELVMAHIYTGYRHLHDANRNMPLEGDTKFSSLKKAYVHASEVSGKTLGVIGFGDIGKEVAKLAYANGMRVIAVDKENQTNKLNIAFADAQQIEIEVPLVSMEDLLKQSDLISIHTPSLGGYLLGTKEMEQMKQGAGIINTARGGLLDEKAAIEAIESGKLSFVALDTFEFEPKPQIQTLMHPNISLSPHVGGATIEAQERIGNKVVSLINSFTN